MLNMIKDLINEKTSFLEEADMLYEDATTGQIDDSIILGEENSTAEESGEDDEKEFEIDDNDNSAETEPEPEENEGSDEDDEDITNTPVEDEPSTSDDSTDILDQPVDDTNIQDTSPADDIDDILNVEIDLKSNTMSDVLPVPPANAAESVPGDDDIMNTRIDSGFEDDFTESTKDKDDTFTIYGVEFKIPEVKDFISRYETKKLTPSFKKKVRNNVIKALKNPKNIKQIEDDILFEEQQIGDKDDTDEIRVKRIKDYLSKSKSKVLLCTTKGNAALHIEIPYTDICAWLEHELWITIYGDKAKAETYDDVTFMENSKNHINISAVSENDIVITEGFLQKIHNFFDGKSDATCKLKKLPPKLKNKVIDYNEKLVDNMEYIIDRDSSISLDPNEKWTAQEYIDSMRKRLFFNIVGDTAIKKRSGKYYGTITIIPHIEIKTYTEIISTSTTRTHSSQTDSEGNRLPGSSSSTTETTRERPEDPKLVEKINKVIKAAVDKLKKSEDTDNENIRLVIYGEGRSYFCAVGFDLSEEYAEKLFNHIKGTEKLTESVDESLDYETVQKLCMAKVIDLMESSNTKYDSLNQFLEAITLGDGDTSADDSADPTGDSTASTDVPDDSGAPAENEVTAAVRDKVAEAGSDENEPTTSKDELLKKLGNITKSLEDAKRAVMNSIPN